jgi:hypothetical protein
MRLIRASERPPLNRGSLAYTSGFYRNEADKMPLNGRQGSHLKKRVARLFN